MSIRVGGWFSRAARPTRSLVVCAPVDPAPWIMCTGSCGAADDETDGGGGFRAVMCGR